jgi:hypothetical protein
MARQFVIAAGRITVAFRLAGTTGCGSTGAGVAADGSVMTLDAQSDASFDASACIAEGGRCAAISTACGAVIPAACGPSEACCVDICEVDGSAMIVLGSNYDQSCTTDSDCVAVATGSTCLPCGCLAVGGLGEACCRGGTCSTECTSGSSH